MGFPGVVAGVGIASSIAGAVTGAIGSEQQGAAQSAMYNYQAGVAQANATVAQQDAIYATQSGEVEAQQSGMRTRFEVGAEKVGQGAGNIDVGSGSALAVRGSQIEVGQQNEGIIRADAAKRAYGFSVGAAEDTAQAGAYSAAASNSKTAGTIGAISSIIGGVGQVSSKWLQASQSFGKGSSNANANPDSPLGQQTYSSSIYN